MSTIKRHYRYSGSRRLHYRRSGTGPPLVMLHAAPGSSFGLRPAISRFADRHSAIALDLPGYGESEPLTVVEPSIADYADWLAEALDALGLERVDLWGAHTGAKVSLEFAVRHPHRVRRLALAGIAAYTGKERRAHIENYTPSPTPESDGSHLIRAWTMRRDMQMFWPWYLNTPEARIHAPLPSVDQLHDTMVDFLRAIPDYWKGYQAAFRYDSVVPLSAIPIPVLVAAAPGDPLAAHLDRFGELPANVKVERPETSDGLVELVEEFLAGDALPAAPPPPLDPPQDGVVVLGYVNTMDGQLVIRKTGAGSGRPLVMFHAAPDSSAPMEPLMLRLGADRPVFAFDTPGNGDSDPLAVEPTIGDFSQALGTTIDTLGLDEFDVYSAHTGALIAIETAISRPTQVPHLIFDGVTLFTPEETQDYLTNYPVPLVFSQDGSYSYLVLELPARHGALVALVQPFDERPHARRRHRTGRGPARRLCRVPEGGPDLSPLLPRGVCLPNPRTPASGHKLGAPLLELPRSIAGRPPGSNGAIAKGAIQGPPRQLHRRIRGEHPRSLPPISG